MISEPQISRITPAAVTLSSPWNRRVEHPFNSCQVLGAAPFGFKGAVLLSCLRVPHPSRSVRRVGLCPCSPGCPAARRESAIIKRRSRDPGAFVAPPSRRHPWHRHSCLCAPFVVAVIPSPARDLQFGWFCGCTRVCPELAKGAFRTVGPNPCFSPLT